MSLKDQSTILRNHLLQCELEIDNLLAGKKASAPRVRSQLQAIKTLAHEMRKTTTVITKSFPIKSKTTKPNQKPLLDIEEIMPPVPPPPVLEREVTEAIVVKPKTRTRKKRVTIATK